MLMLLVVLSQFHSMKNYVVGFERLKMSTLNVYILVSFIKSP